MQHSNIIKSAAKAASYNVLLQFGLRITTFILNGFILRYVSQETLGIVNVRLTLLYSTSLFLAKEAFERACLSKIAGRDMRQVINLLWCTFPLAVLCSSLLGFIWLFVLGISASPTTSLTSYTIGVFSFGLSTVVEVLAEPLFVLGQACLFVKLKVIILGVSQGIKCLLTVLLVLLVPEWGIINFSLAQVTSSVVYAALYHLYFIHYISNNVKKDDDFPLKSVRSLYPSIIAKKSLIDTQLASLTVSFFKQSFLKQILTEGEKFVMTFLDVLSFKDQGTYDIINNLGSLAARFIFLPIEENSFLLFSQLLTRGVSVSEQDKESLRISARVLGVLLKVVTLIGIIIVVFGYSNSFLALHLYGGSMLSSGTGPTLLRWYCLYVLVIAINGTTEAFVFAAMKKDEVDGYNHKMLLFSGVFLLSSWFLTRLIGSVGFILANCLNMTARIAHSVYFITRYFSTTNLNPLGQAVLSLPVLISLALSFIITAVSEHFLCYDQGFLNQVFHVLITGLCLLIVLIMVYFFEHNMISLVKEQFSKGRNKNQTEDSSKKRS